MNIESQVCSLELAKKLKELGVKQCSLFWWEEYPSLINLKYIPYRLGMENENIKFYSAFTVSELGEMLPTKIYWKDESAEYVYLFIKKYPDEYHISYCDLDDKWFDWFVTKDKKEANARAKILINLIENSLIKIEDIK